jgi:hypothetical protein
MNNPRKIDAILSLIPNAEVVIIGNEIQWIVEPETKFTTEEINAELARLQAEYDAKQYQRKRASEYPSFADQFDLLYHGGYEAWKSAIDEVKEKYPKGTV